MTERKSVLLRLDPAVHDALARWASDELRSTNAQIEFLLRRALDDAGRLPGRTGPMRPRGRPRTGSRTPATKQPPEPELRGRPSGPARGRERPPGQLDHERLRRLPDIAILRGPGVGQGSVTDAVQQARGGQLVR